MANIAETVTNLVDLADLDRRIRTLDGQIERLTALRRQLAELRNRISRPDRVQERRHG